LTGIIFVYLQAYLYQSNSFFQSVSIVDYSRVNPLILGSLLGLGAIIGDSVKSFFKRQFNVAPGSSWVPFDQIDYILGGLIFSLPYSSAYLISTFPYIETFVIWVGLHFISTFVGYKLKLKSTPI
jgi:CDP-2,3-bis-(O-geranylgeranyl)-sn-glycerol synthase